jgi:hypothetical protein
MLNAYSPVHYKAFAFILFFTLAEYDKCSPLLYMLLRKKKLLRSLVKMLLSARCRGQPRGSPKRPGGLLLKTYKKHKMQNQPRA